MIKESLASALNAYRLAKTEERLQNLVQEVAVHIFLNLNGLLSKLLRGKTHFISEDLRNDFIAWIYPQLADLIEKFDREKSAFETYLTIQIRFRYCNFIKMKKTQEEFQRIIDAAALEIMERERFEAYDKDFDGTDGPADTAAVKTDVASETRTAYGRKRATYSGEAIPFHLQKKKRARAVLLLTLKSVFDISEDTVKRAAKTCSIGQRELLNLVEIVRNDYRAGQNKFQAAREQHNSYYLKKLFCQDSLRKLREKDNADRIEIEELEKKLEFYERQTERLKELMKRARRRPSNRYLSALLHMPQTTIESTLVQTRKELYADDKWTST